jgi:diguanylate cyclase (GGDEF)-like protein
MRLALSTVLERDGYCVTEAQNGQQALVAANKRMPELIIMDALMPVMDGFDACERIRGLLGGEDIPILMVTALENDHDVERAFDVGATDYIAKPVHFAVLRQRVKRLLAASLAHRQVQHLAYNDTLTGLPNRLLFAERLEGILSRASQGRGRFVAVALLDIDRFQIVNDTLGHDIGDVLIKTAAERINRCVRPDDLVARMGGDEFAIAFENARSREVVEEVASNILSSIAQPFAFLGKEMYVSASIGIALHPEDGGDVHTLMRHADTAMYRAKERGARYRFYEYSMEAAVSRRLGLENELRGALERDEFVVHYQPQLDLGNDVIFGVEALVRWQSSQHGLVPPDEFIGVCEDTGLIHQLGERVMRVACGEVSDWTGRGFGPFKIGINLSARQLEEGDLIQATQRILSETGIDPGWVEFEITESVLMEHVEAATTTFSALKALGVTLAIDDFGTGYSSLGYLKRFPVDVVKIDRTFVRDMTVDRDARSLIRGIIALAKNLRLKVIAEGVETEQQQAMLLEDECDFIQGYLIGKPMAGTEFESVVLRSGRALAQQGTKVTPLRRIDKKIDNR